MTIVKYYVIPVWPLVWPPSAENWWEISTRVFHYQHDLAQGTLPRFTSIHQWNITSVARKAVLLHCNFGAYLSDWKTETEPTRLDISRQFSAEGGQTKGHTAMSDLMIATLISYPDLTAGVKPDRGRSGYEIIATYDVGKLSRTSVYSVSAPVNHFEIIQNLLVSRAQRSNWHFQGLSTVKDLKTKFSWKSRCRKFPTVGHLAWARAVPVSRTRKLTMFAWLSQVRRLSHQNHWTLSNRL